MLNFITTPCMVLSSTAPSAEVAAGETGPPLQGYRAAGDTRLSQCHAAREGMDRGQGGSPAPKRPRLFFSPRPGYISSNAPSAMIFSGDLDSI